MTIIQRNEPGLAELAGLYHRAQTVAMIAALKAKGFNDVTPAYAAVLPLIGQGGTRQSDMARRAALSKQAVGQLVKELVARGYVELLRDPSDVRATLVTFTQRGLELRRCGFEIKSALRLEAASLLGDSLLARMEAALLKLIKASQL